MANEIYNGPQVLFGAGATDTPIGDTNIVAANTRELIEVTPQGYLFFNPNNGSIPQISAIKPNSGYIYNSKSVQNLPAWFKLASSGPVYFFRDSFSGNGAYADHTPETGDKTSVGSITLANGKASLSGAGNIKTVGVVPATRKIHVEVGPVADSANFALVIQEDGAGNYLTVNLTPVAPGFHAFQLVDQTGPLATSSANINTTGALSINVYKIANKVVANIGEQTIQTDTQISGDKADISFNGAAELLDFYVKEI